LAGAAGKIGAGARHDHDQFVEWLQSHDSALQKLAGNATGAVARRRRQLARLLRQVRVLACAAVPASARALCSHSCGVQGHAVQGMLGSRCTG
jgi:hypothetical protein